MRLIISLFSLLLPWKLRRLILNIIYGYEISSSARVGYTILLAKKLKMGPNTYIGHLNVVKGLDAIIMDAHATIGNLNWITGFPSDCKTHYFHQVDRKPILYMGEHTAITNRHLIDCTNSVSIGKFTTIAGFRSVILTHSIDIKENRQTAYPIYIGDYCFIGACCTIIGGSYLPDYSVLGANSMLNKKFNEGYSLYGGVPAKVIKKLNPENKYFNRVVGFVE